MINYFIPVAGLNHYLGNKIDGMLLEITVGNSPVMQCLPAATPPRQVGVIATNKFRTLKSLYQAIAEDYVYGHDFKILSKEELEKMFPLGKKIVARAEDHLIEDEENIMLLEITSSVDIDTDTQKIKELKTGLRKENDNMDLNLQNLGIKFGKASSNFKLSINGIAVKGADNNYYVWDAKSSTLVNVSSMVFDFDALYLMPSKDVKIGDTILHSNTAVSVTEVADGVVTGVRYSDQTIVKIPAMKNIFGFNFYTKVVNLFGDGLFGGLSGESKDAFNPMMLMLLSQNGSNFGDLGQIMLLSQLGGQLFKL